MKPLLQLLDAYIRYRENEEEFVKFLNYHFPALGFVRQAISRRLEGVLKLLLRGGEKA